MKNFKEWRQLREAAQFQDKVVTIKGHKVKYGKMIGEDSWYASYRSERFGWITSYGNTPKEAISKLSESLPS